MGTKRVFSALLHTSWPDPFGSVTTWWQSEGSSFRPGAGEAREPWAPQLPGKCECKGPCPGHLAPEQQVFPPLH